MRTRNKTLLVLLALMICGANAFAQQIPLYSQYYFNKFIYNPALSGQSGLFEANLFGRNQYTQVDGFQTSGLTLSGQVSDGKVGLGLYLINDANLLQTQNSVYANYAYNIKFSDNNALSLGFALGALSNRFNTENIIATDPDDPTLRLLNTRPGAALDASVGANLKLGDFQFGVSVPQFLQSDQEFTDHQQSSLLYTLQNHLILMTSYDIHVNDDLKIQPLVLYKNTRNAPGQFDFNVIADWQNKGWIGAAVRDGYGVTAMAGIKIAEKLRFGYAYDWSTGDYSQALGGTHEIMVGAMLGKKEKEPDGPSKEEMDALKKSLADQRAEDLKEQEEKIEELEGKVARLEKQKARIDTVVVVQKTPVTAKPDDSKPAVEDKPSGNTSGQFMVIAGAFGEETNAKVYFNRLVNKGYSPYMYYSKSNKTYYVHLGRFYFKEEAKKFAKDNTKSGVKLWVKTL